MDSAMDHETASLARELSVRPKGSLVAEERHKRWSRRWIAAAAGGGAATGLGLLLAGPRRRELAAALIGLGAAAGLGLAAYGALEARRPVLEQHEIAIPWWPAALDGLLVGHLSDLHLSSPASPANLRRALRWVEEARPDIIVITGDFIDERDDLELLRTALSGLSAPLGVYAILGNHDYWSDPVGLSQVLRELNITLLLNEHRVIETRGAQFAVAGLDDSWYGDPTMETMLSAVPAGLPLILLAHCPDDILDALLAGRPLLQLSGHAHSGHIVFPVLGPLVLPRRSWRFYRGLHHMGESVLYVSRGLSGIPLRIGAPPEAALLRLRAAEPAV